MRAHCCMLAKTLLQILHVMEILHLKSVSGAKEREEISHSDNEMILTNLDDVRHHIGVVVP